MTPEAASMDSALEGRYEITSLEHATVLAHYRAVMPRLAKHFGGTPVVYVTYPKQLGIDPVFHKGITHAPETIATVEVRTVTGAHAYVALNEHNLTWLVAGRFAVELCGWSPTPSDPDRCAFARIMLSPHGAAPDDLAVEGTRLVRERLAAQGLQAIPMLTGFRGIALWIPFADAPPCSDVGHWAHEFAKELATAYPTVFTIENLHADRGDRVYLGTKSNFPGMGSLLPYALRGSPSLEVQVPLTWDELGTRRNGDVTAANFADYDATTGDVFEALTNAIGAQPFGNRAPKTSGRRPHLTVEVMDLSPHASILSAALAILADGQTRDAASILAIALERHLLPHSTTRKYVYTALHEYVERTLGAGRVPAIVQEQRDGGAAFRLNRKPDTWPNVTLPKLPSWLSKDDIATTVDRLTASATGGDPAAFELAVTHAFARSDSPRATSAETRRPTSSWTRRSACSATARSSNARRRLPAASSQTRAPRSRHAFATPKRPSTRSSSAPRLDATSRWTTSCEPMLWPCGR